MAAARCRAADRRRDPARRPGTSGALADDVLDGLTRPFKELPPKHFYDARGAELFDRICELPEYYPTRTERAILEARSAEIVARTGAAELVELGSGTAAKTRILLRALHDAGTLRPLRPVRRHRGRWSATCAAELVGESTRAARRTGSSATSSATSTRSRRRTRARPRIVAFLGGTIGNFTPGSRRRFLRALAGAARPRRRAAARHRPRQGPGDHRGGLRRRAPASPRRSTATSCTSSTASSTRTSTPTPSTTSRSSTASASGSRCACAPSGAATSASARSIWTSPSPRARSCAPRSARSSPPSASSGDLAAAGLELRRGASPTRTGCFALSARRGPQPSPGRGRSFRPGGAGCRHSGREPHGRAPRPEGCCAGCCRARPRCTTPAGPRRRAADARRRPRRRRSRVDQAHVLALPAGRQHGLGHGRRRAAPAPTSTSWRRRGRLGACAGSPPTRRPLVVAGPLRRHAARRSCVEVTGCDTAVLLPLVAAGDACAAWSLAGQPRAPRAWTEAEVEAAGALVDVAGAPIARAPTCARPRAIDPLTGCLNRGAMEERLAEEIARAQRQGTPLAVRALRPRRLQGDQRRPRPPAGDARPAPRRRRRCWPSSAPSTRSRATAATSSWRSCPTPSGGDPHAAARARVLRRAQRRRPRRARRARARARRVRRRRAVAATSEGPGGVRGARRPRAAARASAAGKNRHRRRAARARLSPVHRSGSRPVGSGAMKIEGSCRTRRRRGLGPRRGDRPAARTSTAPR